MMLMRWSRQKQVVAAEVMVMPRSCSCTIQSMVGGALVDLADLVADAGVEEDALGGRGLAGIDVGHDADVAGAARGVRCVAWCRHAAVADLPAVVGEGLVGLRHPVRVLLLLDGAAAPFAASSISPASRSTIDFSGRARACWTSQRIAERHAARRADLDRHLVGRAADAARAHLDQRLHVVERALEDRRAALPSTRSATRSSAP